MSALVQRRDAILRRLPANARMAEVGVLLGRLSEALLMARPGLSVCMVDNWLPAEEQPESYKSTRDEHSRASRDRAASHRREAQARAAKFGERAVIIEANSVDAAAQVPGASLDLVFLDADHSEEGVSADIAAWMSKVKPGGWIGGHDIDNADPRYDFSGVRRAVVRVFPDFETDMNFTWFARL